MHHGIGVLALVAAIAFAFGERAAKIAVGSALIVMALFFTYVAFRIVGGTL